MKNKEVAKQPTEKHSMNCPKLYGKDCTCDGFHTFDELYEHRSVLFIALCKQIQEKKKVCWRSGIHSDGSFYPGMFLLGLWLENGKQITYHLDRKKYWKMTSFAKWMRKAPKFDGHTSNDVLERINNL